MSVTSSQPSVTGIIPSQNIIDTDSVFMSLHLYDSFLHYDDVIMTMLASQITSLTIVYSIVYSGVNQRKHQSSASLAFVREIHRGPVNFPHKWPVTRKMFPFDDVIMDLHDISDDTVTFRCYLLVVWSSVLGFMWTTHPCSSRLFHWCPGNLMTDTEPWCKPKRYRQTRRNQNTRICEMFA